MNEVARNICIAIATVGGLIVFYANKLEALGWWLHYRRQRQ